MPARLSASLLLLALLLAGCSAPAADVPAATGADASPPTTDPRGGSEAPTARPIPEMGVPCWDTAKDAPEAVGDPGRYEAEGIRRADVVAVEIGIANARRYLDACLGGDLAVAARAALVVEVVNATGEAPRGTLRGGAPLVRVDVAHEGWSSPEVPWPDTAERVRLASGAYGEAWLASLGCDGARTTGWLRDGLAQNVAYGSAILAGDVRGEDAGAWVWRQAEASGEIDRPLDVAPRVDQGGHVGALPAAMLLLAFAGDDGAAIRQYCAGLASGTPAAAFEAAFGLPHADLAATWEVFREVAEVPRGAAGLAKPPAPTAPPCFAAVEARPADIAILVEGEVPEGVDADLRAALESVAGFAHACLGAETLHTWHNVSVTMVSRGDGYQGGGWTMDGDGSGVRVKVDVAHRQFTEAARDIAPDAWRRYQLGSIGVNAWMGSRNCHGDVSQGTVPYWLREGISQYLTRATAAASGDIALARMHDMAWENAVGSGSAGTPLSTWDEPRSDGWPGDWAFLALERLVASAEEGPASIATFCDGIRAGTSATTAFASAFGERLSSVADDPAWPAGP